MMSYDLNCGLDLYCIYHFVYVLTTCTPQHSYNLPAAALQSENVSCWSPGDDVSLERKKCEVVVAGYNTLGRRVSSIYDATCMATVLSAYKLV